MLALIAGTGDLPPALVQRLPEKPLICAMQGFAPDLTCDIVFRLEHLGSFLADLKARGVTEVCMAGAVRRPAIDPSAIDAATQRLVPVIQAALAAGDDGALRAIIGLIEDQGMTVQAAHDIAPDLLPPNGVLTRAKPTQAQEHDAAIGFAEIARMGAADIGQGCVVSDGQIVTREGPEGTDAMLAGLAAPAGGILCKAPKPQQDRRADLPLIGPGTVASVIKAGLAGIVIEARGVMVLDLRGVVKALDDHGLFLWVRA